MRKEDTLEERSTSLHTHTFDVRLISLTIKNRITGQGTEKSTGP